MKNQTLKTQLLASKFPFILAYGKFTEAPNHEIIPQLWKAEANNAPADTISIHNINGELVIKTMGDIENTALEISLFNLADVKDEVSTQVNKIKRTQAPVIVVEEDDELVSEIDFSVVVED